MIQFLNNNVWKRLRCIMFTAAVKIIYTESNPTNTDATGYPRITTSAVYAAVHKVPDEKLCFIFLLLGKLAVHTLGSMVPGVV